MSISSKLKSVIGRSKALKERGARSRRKGKEAIIRSVYDNDYERLRLSVVTGRVVKEDGKSGRKLTKHESSHAIGFVEGYEAHKRISSNFNNKKGK